MKLRTTILSLAPAVLLAAYVALHPGVAFAEPRFAGSPASAMAAGDYTIDPQHGIIGFEVTHLQLSRVHGRFDDFSGKIHADPANLKDSKIEFTAKIDSVDTAVAPRDAHLKTADFFDAAKFPEMTFKSTSVSKARGGYKITGDLTIKGVTKRITIPFKFYGPYTMKGMGDQPARIGVIADPLVIKRSDYGVGSTAPLPDGQIGASDEVDLRISLEATLDK